MLRCARIVLARSSSAAIIQLILGALRCHAKAPGVLGHVRELEQLVEDPTPLEDRDRGRGRSAKQASPRAGCQSCRELVEPAGGRDPSSRSCPGTTPGEIGLLVGGAHVARVAAQLFEGGRTDLADGE